MGNNTNFRVGEDP